MDTLTIGTKEWLVVTVTDLLNVITDLSLSDPHFTVWDANNNMVVNNLAANAQGMQVYCFIDSTTGGMGTAGLWTVGVHTLALRLTAGLEVPYEKVGQFQMIAVP